MFGEFARTKIVGKSRHLRAGERSKPARGMGRVTPHSSRRFASLADCRRQDTRATNTLHRLPLQPIFKRRCGYDSTDWGDDWGIHRTKHSYFGLITGHFHFWKRLHFGRSTTFPRNSNSSLQILLNIIQCFNYFNSHNF